ncbi:MAG: hypothetical protein A2V88_12940 [Elusimicrobia bacterium RBG_16_66_12]|nr:MAG: hypothetical protein A2V88_12940 [Elusimicrobia bacterium RBG_16_66_12]
MNAEAAARLARCLASAWPERATQGWVDLVAERLARWEEPLASKAVESLIDGQPRLPSVYDLRGAYAAAGGDVADPGRRMSPRATPPRGPLSLAERAEVARLRAEVRHLLREVAVTRYDPASDDEEGAR